MFLVDIGESQAATGSMSYAIRGQWTVDVGESDIVLSILLENLGRLSVGLLAVLPSMAAWSHAFAVRLALTQAPGMPRS
jgi:hypothetical protein